MNVIPVESWKDDMKDFQEAAKKYYAGELKRAEYKGISGKFGSYAQKGDEPKSMLRLRMPAGRLTKEKMAFIAGDANFCVHEFKEIGNMETQEEATKATCTWEK